MNIKSWAAAAVIATSVGAGSAQASTVFFDDFAPGYGYNISSTVTLSTAASRYKKDDPVAMPFTAQSSGAVSDIDIMLSGLGTADVSLWTDAGGQLGTRLGTWNVSIEASIGDPCCAPINITGITGVNLVANANYWLEATPLGKTYGGWNVNTLGLTGTALQGGGAVNATIPVSTRLGAFDILGGTATAAPAPEPASWALMVTGFGLVGAALRRRGLAAA